MIYAIDNLSWIFFNIFLACIPIALTLILRNRLHPFIRALLLVVWFLFLPNTIYLVTDIEYLPNQVLRAGMGEQTLLFIEYVSLVFLSITSYMFSLEPVKTVLKTFRIRNNWEHIFYFSLNTLVAFGVVMGKVQRTHSWYVFTQTERVVRDISATLNSQYLLLWVVFCALVINGIYFVFRKYFTPVTGKKRKK